MSDLPLDVANLMGFLVAMMLYRLYVGQFVGAVGMQWVRWKTSPVVAWVTITLFVITTVNIILFILDASNGFIKHSADPGTLGYFRDMWTPIKPLRQFGVTIAGIVADILLLWRVYIIWSRKLLVVVGP
ncbi:hypothetical protein FRB95_013267, partial [Tulasnella sp. JGI-2019a]